MKDIYESNLTGEFGDCIYEEVEDTESGQSYFITKIDISRSIEQEQDNPSASADKIAERILFLINQIRENDKIKLLVTDGKTADAVSSFLFLLGASSVAEREDDSDEELPWYRFSELYDRLKGTTIEMAIN